MAWQVLKYRLTGVAPLIHHNGQTADPLNKFSRQIKLISGKRQKTDADYEEMARLEFYAGLYLDAAGPILPSTALDSMIVAAAKKSKEGPLAKSGVFCLQSPSLEYDGPRTVAELWADERFRLSCGVRVSMARVIRTRPIFRTWAATVELNVEDTVVSPARVDEWLQVAGTVIGIGDWRPQHGRFAVERLA
jgi:hypothetical protein